MTTDILAAATSLSDQDLLTRLESLASNERVASVQLVAHLAALDSRPSVYAAQGFGSLFAYCVQSLRLSEDAACTRIEVARACRAFPLIFDLLASGEMTLTSVRLLARHLTPENHRVVLARATGRSRREIEALVAELAPQPDVPTSVRKLPAPAGAMPPAAAATRAASAATPTCSAGDLTTAGVLAEPATALMPSQTGMMPAPTAFTPARRPIVQATAPERYRIQFTIGQDTHDKLRRLQALLRREIPDGDPGAIFDRGLRLLLEKVEKTKLGATAGRRAERAIRPGADNEVLEAASPSGQPSEHLSRRPSDPLRDPSRHVPRPVVRAVCHRDGGQCTFLSRSGSRCTERTFLELHRIIPYAKGGPSTVENITLRCWRHNHYEGELVFGPRKANGQSFVKDSGGNRAGVPRRGGGSAADAGSATDARPGPGRP